MNGQSGFDLIPWPARVLAAFIAFVCGGFFYLIFGEHRIAGFGTVMGLVLGAFVAAYILLAGYVYGDAERRGMPAVAWTALAVLIPNCLGFVLYFLLRKPLQHPCPHCGSGVPPDAAFCSRCGHPQSNVAMQPS